MIKLLNYNLNSDYESNKESLNQLNHYCVLTKDNNLIHLKNVNKDISYILNYKIANDNELFENIALYLTRADLYKSVKIDGREINLDDKERIPYTCQKYNNGMEAVTEILYNTIMDSETGQINPKYNIYENYTEDKEGVIEVVLQDNLTPQNLCGIFVNNNSLTNIPKDMLIVISKNCTNMCAMFYDCYKLTSLDVSNFDTINVTDMSGMFYNCRSLKELDVSKFNTSKVTDMYGMFSGCTNLTSLDLSSFDTSNVTDMAWMFDNCTNLTHIKCKQAFKEWCITNQSTIDLPTAMVNGTVGNDSSYNWEIVE